MMNQVTNAQTNFYVTGGTLQRDAPSYVRRRADEELYDGLSAGRFCYVLTSRQMGKSSLMVRTAARLREAGAAVAVLDLTAIGQNLTAEQWYDGLLNRTGQQLKLEDELEDFWLDNERAGPLQRWMRAIREVVLARVKGPVVIFVDEIDAVRSLPFSTDEFFAGIREFYNRRTEDAELNRLTFCLLGVATPSDLIRDTRTTPFNIGQRIELTDFDEQEAAPLSAGLKRAEQTGAALLKRILYWTGGHPYLTQRLCQAVAEEAGVTDTGGVDRLCQDLFLSPRARERDDNLLFVRERLLRAEADRAALLDLYAQVRTHKRRVADDEANPLVSVLRLSGITRIVAGYHYVRNRIYYRVFDREWITANMPDAELRRQRAAYRRGVVRAAAVAAVILAVMCALSLYAFGQKRQAERARAAADRSAAEARHNAEEARRLLAEVTRAQQRAEQAQGLAEDRRAEAERERKQAESQTQIAEQQRAAADEQRRKAERAVVEMRRANESRLAAEQGKHAAELATERARVEGLQTRRLLYAVHMNQAQQAWDEANVRRVQTLLGNYAPQSAPQPSDDPADVRGFEWFYLWRLAHTTLDSRDLTLKGTPTATAFSGDGTRLAVASAEAGADGRSYVSVLDARTGQRVSAISSVTYRLQDIDPAVYALAVSPDGAQVVTGHENGGVALFDARTGELLRTFVHRDPQAAPAPDGGSETPTRDVQFRRAGLAGELRPVVRSVAFSPDGRLLATGRAVEFFPLFRKGVEHATRGQTRNIKLWDIEAGREFATLAGHTDGVNAVAFSPDSRVLASAGSDKTIKLWLVPARRQTEQTAAPVKTLSLTDTSAVFLAFSPDGRTLAAACADKTVRLWDMNTGERFGADFAGHEKEITSVSFAPDGRKFATASADRTVRVWAVPPRPEKPQPAPEKSAGVARRESPADVARRDAAAGGSRPAVYQPGMPVNFLPALWSVPAPPATLAAASPDPGLGQYEEAAEALTVLKGHAGAVLSVRFSADGQRLTTVGADEAVKVWAVATEMEWQTLGDMPGPVYALAYAPDGRTVAAGSFSTSGAQTLKLWDAATGNVRLALAPGGNISNASYSPDGRLLATAGPQEFVKLWDAASGRELSALKHPAAVFSVGFDPGGRILAAGCSDGTVKLWDAGSQQELRTLAGHYKSVEAVAFSPDGATLATASHDGTIKLWDVQTGRERVTLRGHHDAVRAVAFSPDGRLLASGGQDNVLILWDVAAAKPVSTLEGHEGAITYVTFSRDGRRLATSSAGGVVGLWDIASEQEVATLKGHAGGVNVAVFSPDGQTLATGGQDRTVKLWHAPAARR